MLLGLLLAPLALAHRRLRAPVVVRIFLAPSLLTGLLARLAAFGLLAIVVGAALSRIYAQRTLAALTTVLRRSSCSPHLLRPTPPSSGQSMPGRDDAAAWVDRPINFPVIRAIPRRFLMNLRHLTAMFAAAAATFALGVPMPDISAEHAGSRAGGQPERERSKGLENGQKKTRGAVTQQSARWGSSGVQRWGNSKCPARIHDLHGFNPHSFILVIAQLSASNRSGHCAAFIAGRNILRVPRLGRLELVSASNRSGSHPDQRTSRRTLRSSDRPRAHRA